MNRTDLEYAISLTLGDHIGDFDIPRIADTIRDHHGPIDSLDDVPGQQYWVYVVAAARTERA